MIGVIRGVGFMVCWAVSSISVVLLFGWPWIVGILVGLVVTVCGVLVVDTDWDRWF